MYFHSRDANGFVMIAIYVNDLNLVDIKTTINHAIKLLTSKFEMKFLERTFFCLEI